MKQNLRYIIWAILVGALLAPAAIALAQDTGTETVDELMEGFGPDAVPSDDPDLEEMITGFDQEAVEPETPPGPTEDPSLLQLDGYLKLGAAWNVAHNSPRAGDSDWRGLSKLRPEIQVDLLAKWHPDWRMLASGKLFYDLAYGLRGQDDFTNEVIDTYERESEWREIYLQGRLGKHMDVKIGRQIVVWGRSDNIRITDTLNPIDLREPGLTDIEDLRLPVAMSRLDGYYGAWNLTGIAIHEIRFDNNPVFGHDFFPGAGPLPPEETPSDAGRNTEWALALNGIFSGKDLSLYWADLFNDRAHVARGTDGGMKRKHARVTMWGAAGNLALGNWLVKTEAAYWTGLEFFNSADKTHQRMDGLAGVEYSGFDDTTLTLEWAVRHLVDFDLRLKSSPDFAQEDEITNALRVGRTFADETVELTLLALIYGPLGQDGALMRLAVDYDWSDAISVMLGAALYQSGDKYTLRNIGDNDRLFAEIKYSF